MLFRTGVPKLTCKKTLRHLNTGLKTKTFNGRHENDCELRPADAKLELKVFQ